MEQETKKIKKRLRLPKRIFENVPAFFSGMEFRPAQSMDELRQAYHLVYLEYLKRGYILPNQSELYLTVFLAFLPTATFVAVYQKRWVLGTVTLIPDSPFGLPMDKIYRHELADVRAQGRIAEVGMLALDDEKVGKGLFQMNRYQNMLFLFYLYRAMYDRFRRIPALTDIVACFHPRHEFIYDFLGFKPLGGLKSYDSVQGSPAVARILNKRMHELDALADAQHQDLMFYWEQPPESRQKYILTPSDMKEFFVDKSSVLMDAGERTMDYLKRCYPAFDLESIRNSAAAPDAKESFSRDVKPAFEEFIKESAAAVGLEGSQNWVSLCARPRENQWLAGYVNRQGHSVFYLDPQQEPGEVAARMNRVSANAVLVESLKQLVSLPPGVFDQIRLVVSLEPINDSDERELLVGSLFSPLIADRSRLFFWREITLESQISPGSRAI